MYAPLERLEDRLLFAQTPASPRPDTLGAVFDKSERVALLSRLTMIKKATYLTLQSNLNANDVAAFDANLLSYMRSRTTAQYFFDTSDAGTIASYINSNIGFSGQTKTANWVTDDRLFPEQSSTGSYSVSLPANINWSDASQSSNPEFLNALNRQEWWVDLAQSYRYTGDAKYMNELLYELADWSSENQTFTLPAKSSQWTSYGLDVCIRVESWMMTYFSVLGSSGWTGAANSLMLYKLAQQADVLNRVVLNTTDFASNRINGISRAELYMGVVFPEFDNAAAWESTGRTALFKALDGQFYNDGSHKEQSPGYASLAISDFLEAYQLDKVNGNTWEAGKLTKIENAVDALWQQLSPDGKRPAIGDTYRVSNTSSFLKPAVILNETRWPEARPRTRDVWILGTSAVNPYLGSPVEPSVGTRGSTYSMSDSGNYVMRSGSDTNARQIHFDAGPKGGGHGHFDLLNFELWGYGKPLIADPGIYLYDDNDPKRPWVISTKAHNTIGVADLNHGQLENKNAIKSTGITSVSGGYMISAGHQGYSFLPGSPTVSRSMWYDGDDTMVVVDFVESTTARNWEQSFTVQNQNTTRDLGAGLIYTKNASGNVRIQSLLRPGQAASYQTSGIFTTSDAPPNHVDAATRYYVQSIGTTFAVFATVITAHSGSAASATATASWVTAPSKVGQSAVLSVNGKTLTFTPPSWQRLNTQAQSRGVFNDIAFDSAGRLHMVFFDRDQRNLKYAVRDLNGVWGTVQIIDGDYYAGYTPSLAIDAKGRPGVAYQEAYNGDLRYAYLSPITNAWEVQVIDVKGSTGLYPDLVFSRNNTPAIAYYNKSNGDLRLALPQSTGWQIQTIDSKGDVGRFPSLSLDPNRPTASKYAIAYEDTINNDVKWTIQYQTGWRTEYIDKTSANIGGYISLDWYDSGKSGDSRYLGVATFFDATRSQLKYAYDRGGREEDVWTSSIIGASRGQGLYSKLFIENNKPRVFFFDGTKNRAYFLASTRIAGAPWTLKDLGAGGRDIHFAYRGGKYFYTGMDETTGFLTVKSF